MPLANSVDDPEITAAFSGEPVATPKLEAVDDPEITAAFKSDSPPPLKIKIGDRMPDGSKYTGEKWQDALLRYSRPSKDNPVSIVGGKVAGALDWAAGKAAAGYTGAADLFTWKGLDRAVSDIQRVEAKHPGYQNDPNATGANAATQQIMDSKANPLNWPGMYFKAAGHAVGQGLNKLGVAPEASGAVEQGIGEAGPLSLGLLRQRGVAPAPGNTGGMTGDPEPISAAKASADLSKASPELQARVAAERQTGSPIDARVLNNHIVAESLPVPIKLTKGQAMEDGTEIARELNARNETPEISARIAEQEKAIPANLSAIRDKVGPEVFTRDAPGHGQTLIESYKAKDAPVVADITAKYKALEDANGGSFPIDGEAFVQNAQAMLRKKLKSNYVPSAIASDMQRFANGEPMTFEDFEAMKTNLAEEMRTADRTGNGNAKVASSIVRQALEDLPLTGEAARLKPLADVARSAARNRFQALEADPAYEAAVNDTVSPDKFVDTFITGNGKKSTVAQVAKMRENLSHDPTAQQTMGVAALDHLTPYKGQSFSQAAFNRDLENMQPKLQHIFSADDIETLDNLGETARLIQQRPKSGQVYVSKSEGLGAVTKDRAADLTSAALSMKVTGGLVPPGWIKSAITGSAKKEAAARAALINDALEPGAGITRK